MPSSLLTPRPRDPEIAGPRDPGTARPRDRGTARPRNPGTARPGTARPGTARPRDPGPRDGETARPRDPGTAGLRDRGTPGPRDRGTSGPRDPGTAGPRDRGTPGPAELLRRQHLGPQEPASSRAMAVTAVVAVALAFAEAAELAAQAQLGRPAWAAGVDAFRSSSRDGAGSGPGGPGRRHQPGALVGGAGLGDLAPSWRWWDAAAAARPRIRIGGSAGDASVSGGGVGPLGAPATGGSAPVPRPPAGEARRVAGAGAVRRWQGRLVETWWSVPAAPSAWPGWVGAGDRHRPAPRARDRAPPSRAWSGRRPCPRRWGLAAVPTAGWAASSRSLGGEVEERWDPGARGPPRLARARVSAGDGTALVLALVRGSRLLVAATCDRAAPGEPHTAPGPPSPG